MNRYIQSGLLLYVAVALVSYCQARDDMQLLDDILTQSDQLRSALPATEEGDRKLNKLIDILKGYIEPPHPRQRSKRIFCNTFCGCGNCGKRSDPNSVKRNTLSEPVSFREEEPSKPKRLYCNPWGCGNVRKRTVLSKFLKSLRYGKEDESDDFLRKLDGDNDVLSSLE